VRAVVSALLATALIGVAAACGGSSARAYPADAVATFTSACESGFKARGNLEDAPKRCSCLIQKLEQNVSYEDFVAYATQIAHGGSVHQLSPKMKQDFEACQGPLAIPSSSMEPTLRCAKPGPGCTATKSDQVKLSLTFGPSRGDIMAFRTPPKAVQQCGEGGVFVKRLIGLPGETVSERNGRVFVDGKPLHQPYVKFRDTQSGAWHVPHGQYFFLGDNRAQSCDSRQWGSVPRANLIGKVVQTIRNS